MCRTERNQDMNTQSVTTPLIAPVGRVDRQVNDVKVRNRLLDALTVSSGTSDPISFLALGKVFSAFMTGNIAFLGMWIAKHRLAHLRCGTPRILWLLVAMAGFAGGVYLATKIVKSSRQPGPHQGEQPNGVVWPQRTTLALGLSLLAHLCFVLIWFATTPGPVTMSFPFSWPRGRWQWECRALLFATLTSEAYLRLLQQLPSSSCSAPWPRDYP